MNTQSLCKTGKGIFQQVAKKSQNYEVLANSKIGTEVKDLTTGIRYFQAPKIQGAGIQYHSLPKQINPDGTYSSIQQEAFEALLKKAKGMNASQNYAKLSETATKTYGSLSGYGLTCNNPKIGTEIVNHGTGVRYFQAPAIKGAGVEYNALPKQINPDGTSSSISQELFDNLLKMLS